MLKDDREKGKNVNEQARLIMLKLLRELDRICTKYDIPVSYTHLTLPTKLEV